MLRWVLISALSIGLIFPAVYAQECGELVLQIRDLNATSFDEYPQLNDMKQDALLILYSRERATCPADVSSISVFTMKFINDFEHAYNLSKDNDVDSQAASLENSMKLSDAIQAQQKRGLTAESQGIIDSANRAMKEFLLVLAKVHATNAEATSVTGEKISHYKKATQAYLGAGETIEAENLRLKWQSIERDYLEDLNTADGLISLGDTKYKAAKPMRYGNAPAKIEAYILSRSASIDFARALVYYNFHAESDKISMTTERIADVNEMMVDLRQIIFRYFVLSLISLMGLSLYLLNRLKSWHGDTYDYSLGNELVRVSSGVD